MASHSDVQSHGNEAQQLFHAVSLPACGAEVGTVSCLTTVTRWLVIGTGDGRVLFYYVDVLASGAEAAVDSYDATLVHTHTSSSSRQPISQLVALPDARLLLVGTGETIAVYRVPSPLWLPQYRPSSPSAPLPSGLSCVAEMSGLTDLMAFHVRKQRQLYTLALLHKRKLALYDVRDLSSGEPAAREQSVRLAHLRDIALPDGVRCFVWCGKNAILGFRRSYVYVQLSSGATEEIGAVGKATEPFLRAMHPVPEVLLVHDSVCQRTLPDGTAAPGQSAFSWQRTGGGHGATAKAAVMSASSVAYCHPFLCGFSSGSSGSHRLGSSSTTAATMEVRLPLLTTLSESVAPMQSKEPGAVPSTWCGQVTLPCESITAFSHDGLNTLVDLDVSFAAGEDEASPKAPVSLAEGIVCASAKGSLFFLAPVSLRAQAIQLASEYGYQAAELLCEVSAQRSTTHDRQIIRTLAAVDAFAAGHYQAAVQRLRQAQSPAAVAVALLESLLASTGTSPHGDKTMTAAGPRAALVALLPTEMQATVGQRLSAMTVGAPASQAALESGSQPVRSGLAALQGFLLSCRIALRHDVTSGQNEAVLRCVDTALVQSYAFTDSDEAVIDLLRDTHWCDPHTTEICLRDHQLWSALAALWRSTGDLDKPLQLFRALTTEGVAPTAATTATARHPAHARAATSASARRVPRAVYEAICSVADGPASTGVSQLIACGAPTRVQLRTLIDSATSPDVEASLGGGEMRAAWPQHISGLVCALAYVHQLSWADAAHLAVLRTHVSWLLGTAPGAWARVALFGLLRNAQQYPLVLSVVRGAFDETEGWRSALEVESSLLFAIIEDERVPCNDAAVHSSCWKSAALLVLTGQDMSSGSGGVVGAEGHTKATRARLDRLLEQSQLVDIASALTFFQDEELRGVSVPERSILYQRLGDHEAAMNMFLYEQRSVSAATQYALRAHETHGDDAAFTALFRMLAHPRDADCEPRTDEILHVLRTCKGINITDALPLLPDTIPMTELGPLLLRSMRDSTTDAHREAVYGATLSSRANQCQLRWIVDASTRFSVSSDSICAVCLRPLRAESVFLRYPNGVLAHPTCVDDEHICPVTRVDFSRNVTSTLLHHNT